MCYQKPKRVGCTTCLKKPSPFAKLAIALSFLSYLFLIDAILFFVVFCMEKVLGPCISWNWCIWLHDGRCKLEYRDAQLWIVVSMDTFRQMCNTRWLGIKPCRKKKCLWTPLMWEDTQYFYCILSPTWYTLTSLISCMRSPKCTWYLGVMWCWHGCMVSVACDIVESHKVQLQQWQWWQRDVCERVV